MAQTSPHPAPHPAPRPSRPGPVDWALLAALVMLWGSAYAMTHVAVAVLPPAVTVSARLWIGAAVLGLASLALRARLPPPGARRVWSALALIGFTGTLAPFLLISAAQTEVPSALAAIYIAAAPLVVAGICHVFIPQERLDATRAAGVAAGFAGICLLFGPALIVGGAAAAPILPQAMLLAAAALYGATSVIVRVTAPDVHPVSMTFAFVFMAALMSTPLALLAWPEGGVDWPDAGPQRTALVWSLIGLGAGSTGLANLVYVLSIRRVGPLFMSNVGNLAPFWSICLGFSLFGEALPATTFAALGLLLFGVWLAQRRT